MTDDELASAMTQGSRSTSRTLVLVAACLLIAGLLPSVVLGYSGDSSLASIGNVLFLVTVVSVALLLVLALMFRRR